MRSHPYSVRIPVIFFELLKNRAQALGYSSISAYIVGLIQYDLMTSKDHEVTAEITKLPTAEQNAINRVIVRMYNAGQTIMGSWFERVLKNATQEVAKGKDVESNQVVKSLVRKIQADEPLAPKQ